VNEIIFLTKKDRDRLSDISQTTGVLSKALAQERDDILSRRKTLRQMTIAECQTMKVEINQKIAKIAAIGRVEHTRIFLSILQQLDERIYSLMRNPPSKEPVDANAIRLQKARKTNPLARPVRSRWAARTVVGNPIRDASEPEE